MEQHAMIFMVLAGLFLYLAREGGTHRIIFATLFGILGYWTRQDHLGAIAGLAFLAFESVGNPLSAETQTKVSAQWLPAGTRT